MDMPLPQVMLIHVSVKCSMHWTVQVLLKIQLSFCGEIMVGNWEITPVGVSTQTLNVIRGCL